MLGKRAWVMELSSNEGGELLPPGITWRLGKQAKYRLELQS
jgi:hypothetical protein